MNKKQYLLRSYLVANLVKLGIVIYWENDEPDNNLEINSWLQLNWGLGRLELENVVDGLGKLKSLFAKLSQDLVKIEGDIALPGDSRNNLNKLKLEWNYLGNSVDRENYLLELTNFFWQSQNEELVLGHSQFVNWMEEPWQIINFAEELGLNLPLAANQFSQNSLNLFDNLEKNLDGCTFQPYLIVSAQSSFQFKISLENKSVLSGVIIPAGDIAYLELYL